MSAGTGHRCVPVSRLGSVHRLDFAALHTSGSRLGTRSREGSSVSHPAGWYPDPTNPNAQRYWDGSVWTDHVSINSDQSIVPLEQTPPSKIIEADGISEQPARGTSVPATPNPVPAVERGPATSPDQQPSSTRVLWEGQRESLTSTATQGRLASSKYRITEDAIHFEAGLLSTRAEMVPIWLVVDVDLTQSMTQKARSLGDLTLNLGADAARFGQKTLVLESVRDPRSVRDLIISRANDMRSFFTHRMHQLDIERRSASSSSVNVGVVSSPATDAGPAPLPAGDQSNSRQELIDHLRQLGELRDLGVLTEDEFQHQKRQLLG